MSQIIPYDSGLVALVGDLHFDHYGRAEVDPIVAGGLSDLPWPRLDALIVTGDLANSPLRHWRPLSEESSDQCADFCPSGIGHKRSISVDFDAVGLTRGISESSLGPERGGE